MSAIADELSRRTSSDYIGGRAREVARMRADDARRNPKMLGTLGALAGGAIGMALAKSQRRHKRESWRSQEWYPYGASRSDVGYGGGRFRGERFRTGYGAEGFRTEPTWVSREETPSPSWDAYPYGGRPYEGPDYVASPEVSRYEGWVEETGQPGQEQGERGAASEKAQQLKERASTAAEGLKGKAEEFKERVSHKAADFREHEGPSLKEKISHKASDLKDMASERSGTLKEKGFGARDRMRERASSMREHMPSGDQFREQSHEHPMAMLFGSLLIGAAAAALLPLTSRERRVMHPAREKASSQLGSRFKSIEQRFESALGGGESHEQEEGSYSSSQGERSFSSRDEASHSEEAEEPYRQPDFAEVAEEAQKDDTLH